MFKLIEKIENVRSFALDGDYLYLNLTSKKVIEYYTNKILISDVWLTDFINYSNSIFINGIYPGSFHICEMNVQQFDYSLLYLEKDILIRRLQNEKEGNKTLILNYKTNEVCGEIDTCSLVFIKHNNIYCKRSNDKKKIEAYSFPEAKSLWEFELSQLGKYNKYNSDDKKFYKLRRFLYVIGNELFVSIDRCMLLVLDIATGEETRRWHFMKNSTKDYLDENANIVGGSEHFKKSDNEKYLHKFNDKYYVKIDLQTNEVFVEDLTETLNKNKIRVFRNQGVIIETKDNLLTIGEGVKLGPKDDHVVLCAVNKMTFEIERLYTDPDFSLINDMYQLLNDKLYILNATNDLMIFEKME